MPDSPHLTSAHGNPFASMGPASPMPPRRAGAGVPGPEALAGPPSTPSSAHGSDDGFAAGVSAPLLAGSAPSSTAAGLRSPAAGGVAASAPGAGLRPVRTHSGSPSGASSSPASFHTAEEVPTSRRSDLSARTAGSSVRSDAPADLHAELRDRHVDLERRAASLTSRLGWSRRAARILTVAGVGLGLLVFVAIAPVGAALPFIGLAAGLAIQSGARFATKNQFDALAAERNSLEKDAEAAGIALTPMPKMAKLDRFYGRGPLGDLGHEGVLVARPLATLLGGLLSKIPGVSPPAPDPQDEADRNLGRQIRERRAAEAASQRGDATPGPLQAGAGEHGHVEGGSTSGRSERWDAAESGQQQPAAAAAAAPSPHLLDI